MARLGRVNLIPKKKLVLAGRFRRANHARLGIGETAGPARITHIREAKVGWVGLDLSEQIVCVQRKDLQSIALEPREGH